MATGRAIVKKAIEQLDQTLSPEDERFFRDTTLRDLWRDARGIESELGERRDLRYMRRIEGFLRTMESYSGVIEVFCQGFSPMAFVWVCLEQLYRFSADAESILGTYQTLTPREYPTLL